MYLLVGNSSKYILKKKLGTGITCTCYLGQKLSSSSKIDSEPVAIKILKIEYQKYFENEIKIVTQMASYDNIVKLYENGKGYLIPITETQDLKNIEEENNDKKQEILYEVMEYAVNGELKDYVQDNSTRIPEHISAKIFLELALTLKNLHSKKIAHGDIKPENVFLGKNFKILLGDFGFSHMFDPSEKDFILHRFVGSEIYCGPETRKAYTKGFNAMLNDIFSLGVLLFVITIGEFPFLVSNFSDERYKNIINGSYNSFWKYYDHIEISDEFKDLIVNLINNNPSKRLSLDEVIDHPWLKKYINRNTNNKTDTNLIDEDVIKELSSRKI